MEQMFREIDTNGDGAIDLSARGLSGPRRSLYSRACFVYTCRRLIDQVFSRMYLHLNLSDCLWLQVWSLRTISTVPGVSSEAGRLRRLRTVTSSECSQRWTAAPAVAMERVVVVAVVAGRWMSFSRCCGLEPARGCDVSKFDQLYCNGGRA